MQNIVRTKKSRKNQNGQANKPTGKRHEKALHTHTHTQGLQMPSGNMLNLISHEGKEN